MLAPRCYYFLPMLLSSHVLDNIQLKHIWRFKGPVKIEGKILRELTCSHFGTGRSLHYFACFCAEKRCHNPTSLLRILSVGGITVKSGLKETRLSERLFLFIYLFFFPEEMGLVQMLLYKIIT